MRTLRLTGILFAAFLYGLSLPSVSTWLNSDGVDQGSSAYAEDDDGKKSKKRRKKRRKRKRDAASSDNAKRIDPEEATTVIGADSGFDHSDFDQEVAEVGGGLDAVMVLDASRSMQRTDPDRLRDQGAKLFLRFLSEGDRIAVVQFAQDTSILYPLTAVSPDVQTQLDEAIESVSVEGNFTDLWSPIAAAMEILTQEGRPGSQKAVILLSDGKMDPHPSVGNSAALISKLKNTDLPLYKDSEIKLYTLALSDEADRDLLAEMAKLTKGLHWFAPDVNTIHQIFSDLFLTIKQPQVVQLEGAGFEVDGTTTEATFYISRKESKQLVTVVDPRGKEFTNVDFPPGVKWYRGALFDVITIRQPLPGRWGIIGVEEPEGFATLLTDLKLQVRWPESNIRVGDSMVMMVRLTEKGEHVSTPGMKDVTFYTYKVIDSRTGQLILQGGPEDNGENGDASKGDGIFSAMIKIDKPGDYKALIAVAGPTFSRQQHISFNVSTGSISLVLVPPNEFIGEEEALRVKLGGDSKFLKKLNVLLVARLADAKTAIAIPLRKFRREDGDYDVPVQMLKKGEYELHARVSGLSVKTKKKFEAQSESIPYVSDGATEELIIEDESEDFIIEEIELEEKDPAEEEMFYGLISLGSSTVWVGLLGFLFYRKTSKEDEGISIEAVPAYAIPEDLEARLAALREKSSEERRLPNPKERELFALVADRFGAEKVEEAEDGEKAEGEAEAEDSGDSAEDAGGDGEGAEAAPEEAETEPGDEAEEDEAEEEKEE